MGEISLTKFEVGMAIEMMYITPDNGRPTLDLKDKCGNIVLHVNPRWDQKVFVLNTNNGGWGSEERPHGFDFSSGVPITVRLEAKSDHFVILVNGNVIHYYKHRMPVTSVCSAQWHWSYQTSGDKEAKLISLSVYY